LTGPVFTPLEAKSSRCGRQGAEAHGIDAVVFAEADADEDTVGIEGVFAAVFVCFDFRFSALFDAEFGSGVGDADGRAFLSGLVGGTGGEGGG